MVLVGERLAHDDGIRMAQLPKNLLLRVAGYELGLRIQRVTSRTSRSAEASVAGIPDN